MKFAKLKFALPILAVFVISCGSTVLFKLWPELTAPKYVDPAFRIPSPLELASIPALLQCATGEADRPLAGDVD